MEGRRRNRKQSDCIQDFELEQMVFCVTLNPDGSPQVSLVWVGLDGEEVVCAHLGTWKKVSNIQQDARFALSLETGEKTGGVVDYVVLSGRARITEGGAPELLQQLARVYLGPGIKYPPSDHAPAGYITHIQIERVYGDGSWKTAGNKREG